ncbi:MAG: hypothetical protein AAF546_11380 [Verrucomicrobiota bacterium]
MTQHSKRSKCILLVLCTTLASVALQAKNVNFPARTSETGFLAALLVNEVAFPGERGYISKGDSIEAMNQILLVLDARIFFVPSQYTRYQIAQTSSDRLINIITAGGYHGQVEGFYQDDAGTLRIADRVEERLQYLLQIANDGRPGTFASMIQHSIALANAYIQNLHKPKNQFKDLRQIQQIPVTGRAYSWMTDRHYFHPGGNFIKIPNNMDGALSGNRFFSLRKLY